MTHWLVGASVGIPAALYLIGLVRRHGTSKETN
jgi:hypothetical protein